MSGRGHSIPGVCIIPCLKAWKMISKGCLYHIVRVQDLDSVIPPIESVVVVSVFLEFFPKYLPVFLPNGKFILV